MLRRRPDDSFELRYIEHAMRSVAVPRIAHDRREALRARIMASIGEQDPARALLWRAAREHWILVPAGVGIIGAIFATAVAVEHLDQPGRDASIAHLDGGLISLQRMPQGHVVATADQWVSFRTGLAVGIEEGSALRYGTEDGVTAVRFVSGQCTVVTANTRTVVTGPGFSLELGENSIVRVETLDTRTRISSLLGSANVTLGGSVLMLGKGESVDVLSPGAGGNELPGLPADTPGSSSGAAGLGPSGNEGQAPQPHGKTPAASDAPAAAPAPAPQHVTLPSEDPSNNAPPSDSGTGSETIPGPGSEPAASVENQPTTSPALPPETSGPETLDPPPASPPGSDENGQPNGNGHANGNANGQVNGNSNANANGQANGNANGQANANDGGNGNANGQANGSGNGSANGQANGNGNANGNANGQANSQANANGNGNAKGHQK